MNAPRRARILRLDRKGWLVLFPNNVAFAIHDEAPTEYADGWPCVYFPWDESKFDGQIIEWIDEP